MGLLGEGGLAGCHKTSAGPSGLVTRTRNHFDTAVKSEETRIVPYIKQQCSVWDLCLIASLFCYGDSEACGTNFKVQSSVVKCKNCN